jgi:pilus assembly protein Flp/PilA
MAPAMPFYEEAANKRLPRRRGQPDNTLRDKAFDALRGGARSLASVRFEHILANSIGKITSTLLSSSLAPCSYRAHRGWCGRATAIEALRTNRGSLEMRGIIAAFIADEAGATAIEYGLIAAGISIAIIVAVNNLGSTLNTTFTGVNTQLR